MKINHVVLLGVGGTGGHLALSLARTLAYHPAGKECRLTLWDGDRFEESNLNRQVCLRADNDRLKAEVVLDMVEELELDVEADCNVNYLAGPESLHRTLHLAMSTQRREGGLFCIITAVDNDQTRAWVYEALDEFPALNVVVIDPANDLASGGVMCWLRVEGHTPFVHPRDRYLQLRNPTDRPPGGGCAEKTPSTPQLITANMMAATLALEMVRRVLTDEDLFDELNFNLENGKAWPAERWSWQRTTVGG